MSEVRFLGNGKPYHNYFGQLHGNQVVSCKYPDMCK